MDELRLDYESPRWSGEIIDCSLPMTFDSYSICSYGCLYCFSNYQKEVGHARQNRFTVRGANIEAVIRMFEEALDGKRTSQFSRFIQERRAIQWGGLADPFDEYERKYGLGLKLLKYFRKIQYPVAFSTKATWWTEDPRYVELLSCNHFNVKFSIISLDTQACSIIEAGVPSPQERLEAMKRASAFVSGGVVLRLRPYLIGLSDKTAVSLVTAAAGAGAEAVSMEFFCLERRSPRGSEIRYPKMSKVLGYDVVSYYKLHSKGSGYLRLNREVKRSYVDEVEAVCREKGLRFYVSDSDFKERCDGGSCCGLPDSWNWSRGQATAALLIAKERGTVTFADVAPHLEYAKSFKWRHSKGFNTHSTTRRVHFWHATMFDYLKAVWNDPSGPASLYKYFRGVLVPVGVDDSGNVVYRYNRELAEGRGNCAGRRATASL